MARRNKPAWYYQREAEYAAAREAYLRRTDRPVKTTVDARPMIDVGYIPVFYKVGETLADVPLIRIPASQAAVNLFTAGRLNLQVGTAIAASAMDKPQDFMPSMMRATRYDGTPTAVKAYNGTGRRYVKYAGNTDGSSQSHFNAPVSPPDETPTLGELKTVINAILDAKNTILGTNGGALSYSIESVREIEF